MHGFIFNELKKYVTQKLDNSAWDLLIAKSDLNARKYFPVQTYPDSELEALLTAVTEVTGLSRDEILEDFGAFLLSDLLKLYNALIHPNWKTLDLLENTEKTMHTAVRYADKKASPPALICNRISNTEVSIDYISDRHMSALGIGIIKGIADHFKEKVEIIAEKIMRNEKEGVKIYVKLLQEQ